MIRLQRFILRLYPSEWRQRYGAEMESLLEDTHGDSLTALNLFTGAISMQFRSNSFAKLALLWSLGGLAAGYAGSYLITPVYVSNAVLRLNSSAPRDKVMQQFLDVQTRVLSRSSLASIIQRTPGTGLYRRQLTRQPLEDIIEEMRGNIKIQMQSNLNVVKVSFSYPDKFDSVRALGLLIGRFQQESRSPVDEPSSQADPFLVALEHIEARLSALEQKAGLPATVPHPVGNGLAIAILDAPSYPNAAVSPNRPVLAAAGFAIGFFAALVIFLVRRSKAAMPGLPSWSAE